VFRKLITSLLLSALHRAEIEAVERHPTFELRRHPVLRTGVADIPSLP